MLRLRRIAIDSYPENMAFLSRTCTVYRAEEFQALKKIEVSSDSHHTLDAAAERSPIN